MAAEQKSEIALALEERAKNRKTLTVEGMAFCGPGFKVVGSVALRVATKQEENAAIAQAEAYVASLSKQAQSELRDPELVRDAKTVFILASVCRDPKNPGAMPAFGSGSWMMQHFTRDEIAVLLGHYNRFAAVESPLVQDLDEDEFERTTTSLAQFAETEIADQILQNKDRIWLAQFAILAAVRIGQLRREIDAVAEVARSLDDAG